MYSDINFLADNLPKNDFKVCALDFDKNTELASKLKVSSFPSLFMVDDKGNLEQVDMGSRSIHEMLNVICRTTSKYNGKKKICKKFK